MLVKVFWQQGCALCPQAKELGKTLESGGARVEYFDVKTPDGLAEAVLAGVAGTPSIVVLDEKGNEVAGWRGQVPSLDELKAAAGARG